MIKLLIFLDTFYLYPGRLYKLQLSRKSSSSEGKSYKNFISFISPNLLF